MISTGYKSAYQQGYSDAMRDFRKKPKTDVLDKIRAEISSYGTNSGMLLAIKIIDKYRGEKDETDN